MLYLEIIIHYFKGYFKNHKTLLRENADFLFLEIESYPQKNSLYVCVCVCVCVCVRMLTGYKMLYSQVDKQLLFY
jgi:hypothetical protein